MKGKKIAKMILIILLLFTLVITLFSLRKIYLNKIRPIKDKMSYLEKLDRNNESIKKKVNIEKNKAKNIEKISEENIIEIEKLEKIVYENERKLNGKVIYLTFDDGPSIYTDEILDILDKYNIKATFFVTCSSNTYEYKKILEKNHTIGLHTCSHKYSNIYSSEENYFNDLDTISKLVESNTGYKSKYVRFPGGSSNTVSRFNKGIITRLSNMLKENGYEYYDWNIDSNDAGGANSEQIYSNVIGALQKNNRDVAMVLMHDTKVATRDALENIIKDALDLGYTFSKISNYTPEVHHIINN